MLNQSIRTGACAIRMFGMSACLLTLAGCGTVSAPVSGRGEPESGERAVESPAPAELQEAAEAHVVVRGDTLYSIAWRYGQDYRAVAQWNGIENPYVIYPGQRLRLRAADVLTDTPATSGAVASAALPQRDAPQTDTKSETRAEEPAVVSKSRPAPTAVPSGPVRWHWPTEGRIVQSDAPTSKKGVNIAGRLGQPIHAAAHGAVVYSGSGLLGYGRLIIIKHSDTYLSAYAHNDSVLVKEGDRVDAGQQIATMGRSSATAGPMLHFEIRKDGLPVNPLSYLPRRSA